MLSICNGLTQTLTKNLLQLELRISNEKYLRQHPELTGLINFFIFKVLDEKPEEILKFAGKFFDRAELRDVVTQAIQENQANEARNAKLNDLIKGKTLIE